MCASAEKNNFNRTFVCICICICYDVIPDSNEYFGGCQKGMARMICSDGGYGTSWFYDSYGVLRRTH